ncbi:MAG: isoaspartyl peptidase/L-asparaginase [Bacteroidota bacterium]
MLLYSLALHGGAGTILRSAMTPEKEAAYRAALGAALNAGTAVLQAGGTALDAVTATVKSLEDCPLFNAGRGSVFTRERTHEMDAAIMDGSNLQAGAVAGVKGIRNPILAARSVMEQSGHVMLAGTGAEAFARSQNLAFEPDSYFDTEFRLEQLLEVLGSEDVVLDHSDKKAAVNNETNLPRAASSETPHPGGPDKKFSTVGAVAKDIHGNIAAATSTGGMTNKRWGRIGDSPVIGAGTYANNATCAVSATGFGEFFLRYVVAHDVSALMSYAGMPLAAAADKVIMQTLAAACPDSGGLIAVDAEGNIAMPYNSDGMYRAAANSDGLHTIAIYGDE